MRIQDGTKNELEQSEKIKSAVLDWYDDESQVIKIMVQTSQPNMYLSIARCGKCC